MFTPEIRLALTLGLAGKMIGGEARRLDVGADDGLGAGTVGWYTGAKGLCEKERGLAEKGTGLEAGWTKFGGGSGPWACTELEGYGSKFGEGTAAIPK